MGSRYGQPAAVPGKSTSRWHGQTIPIPTADALSKFTARVNENGRVPQSSRRSNRRWPASRPCPCPRMRASRRFSSTCLYILKENKTYDEVFGDMTQGNGNANLCIYPQFVTPNHHALAQQYVLLDNFYCNGVNSADGHSLVH